jgi:hypothetical protein
MVDKENISLISAHKQTNQQEQTWFLLKRNKENGQSKFQKKQ